MLTAIAPTCSAFAPSMIMLKSGFPQSMHTGTFGGAVRVQGMSWVMMVSSMGFEAVMNIWMERERRELVVEGF